MRGIWVVVGAGGMGRGCDWGSLGLRFVSLGRAIRRVGAFDAVHLFAGDAACMNIVFFGSGEFGVPTLARLAERHRLLAVVTQPDRPAGRGGKVTPTAIAQWAAGHVPGVPIFKPEKVSEPGVLERLRGIALGEGGTGEGAAPGGAACFVVIAFGQKMPRALLEGIFAINLHASLLPRWRGAAPINAAMLAGDAVTGNSVITLAERMDAGLVLGQTRRAIDPGQTAGELHDALAADGPELVERVLTEHAEGRTRGEAQVESLVTKAAKLSKADGVVDWSRSAVECRQRVHGLTPWPGVAAMMDGDLVKLLRVREAGERGEGGAGSAMPGTVVDVERGLVACGMGTVLEIREVLPAGKRAMAWGDFIRGRRVEAGTVLGAPVLGR